MTLKHAWASFLSVPNRPTLLQVLPALESGGVERGTIEIASAIAAQGWRPLVASNGGALEGELARSGADHFRLPVHKRDPLSIYRNISKLTRLIREQKVSLIHARSRAPAWSAYYAAKQCNIPFVTTFHGFYGMNGLFKRSYNSVMARGDRVIAISEFIRDYVVRYYPECAADQLEVIHRGADLKLFHPQAVSSYQLSEMATKWHLIDEQRPILLLPGRLTRIKGHALFLEALSRIRNRDFVALFVGSDRGREAYRQELEEKIRASGLEGRVRWVGGTSHMTEAYALADMIIVPTTIPEAFGRVPVEAQAMGKLVIASNHGGMRETIKHGETGFLVEPNNSEALARQLLAALEMPTAKRAQISAAAMQNAQQNFSISQMQEKTMKVYEQLL
jgi:glycosyltransferase involved in cell wall biosynthesis